MANVGTKLMTPVETAQAGVWGLDWTDELDTGETISTITVTATDEAGVDVTATICPSGGVKDATSKFTTAKIDMGIDGKDYTITHLVTTSAGNVWEDEFIVKCRTSI